MRVAIASLVAALLSACANLPAPAQPVDSPCAQNEASYECQVQRYRDVSS